LDRIMEVTGRPTPEDVDAIKSPFAATMLESLPMSRPRPLNEMFPTASVEALDLLRLCLQFNPSKRISAGDALRHPYVVQFHNPEDEFDCDRVIRIPIDDNTKLTVQDYRERLYNEVLKKKKEQRRSHRRNLEMQQQQQQVVSQQQYTHHQAPQTGVQYASQGSVGSSHLYASTQHGVQPQSQSGTRTVAGSQAPSQYYQQSSSQPNYHYQDHSQAQTYAKHNGATTAPDPRYTTSSMAAYSKKK